jgi:hypothetical protein
MHSGCRKELDRRWQYILSKISVLLRLKHGVFNQCDIQVALYDNEARDTCKGRMNAIVVGVVCEN